MATETGRIAARLIYQDRLYAICVPNGLFTRLMDGERLPDIHLPYGTVVISVPSIHFLDGVYATWMSRIENGAEVRGVRYLIEASEVRPWPW